MPFFLLLPQHSSHEKNKYTIRYILGSNNKTLEQKDITTFKERFIKHLNENNLNIAL